MKERTTVDHADIKVFTNIIGDSYHIYKKNASLDRALRRLSFINKPRSKQQIADQEKIKKYREQQVTAV